MQASRLSGTMTARALSSRALSSRALSSSSATSLPPPLVVHDSEALTVSTYPVTPFQMNQYMVQCKRTLDCALVDCGDDRPERWLLAAEEAGGGAIKGAIKKILQTHGHVDHVVGLGATKDLLGVDIYACEKDWPIFLSAPVQGAAFGLSCPSPPSIDVHIKEGDVLEVGELRLAVMETPGHSPGHVCFHIASEKVLVAGDLVFRGGIGRTDFPGCSEEDMRKSLERVKVMDRETVVFSGHGGETTVGAEVDTNPFLR